MHVYIYLMLTIWKFSWIWEWEENTYQVLKGGIGQEINNAWHLIFISLGYSEGIVDMFYEYKQPL